MDHFNNHVPKRAKLLRAHGSGKAGLIHCIGKTIYIRRSIAGGEIKVERVAEKVNDNYYIYSWIRYRSKEYHL